MHRNRQTWRLQEQQRLGVLRFVADAISACAQAEGEGRATLRERRLQPALRAVRGALAQEPLFVNSRDSACEAWCAPLFF